MNNFQKWGGIIAILLLIFCLNYGELPEIEVPIGTTTYQKIYSDYPSINIKRFKIVTSKGRETEILGKKQIEGKLTNKQNTVVKGGLSRTKNKTGTFSLSAKIPLGALKKGVEATIGGALSYSVSTTVSITGDIPPHSSRYVYLRIITRKYTFNHKKQLQYYTKKKGWYDKGKANNYSSTVSRKYPELIF